MIVQKSPRTSLPARLASPCQVGSPLWTRRLHPPVAEQSMRTPEAAFPESVNQHAASLHPLLIPTANHSPPRLHTPLRLTAIQSCLKNDTIMSTTLKIQNQVRLHRAARNWSQQELATRAGISRTEVSAIETGRLLPSIATALALSHAFQCRLEDLFQTQA